MVEQLTEEQFQFDETVQKQKDQKLEESQDKKRLRQLIADMGDTPKAIYKTLKSKGIKGIRNLPCYDPIAMMLKEEFQCDMAYVSNGMINLIWDFGGKEFQRGDMKEARGVTCLMSPTLMEFVVEFDNGAYPKIEFDLEKAIRKARDKDAKKRDPKKRLLKALIENE